jgi:heat shock 70kDa protein 1/2/6/8
MIEFNEPVIIPNQEGKPTTPSVVAFRSDGSILVGAQAQRQAAVNPNNTFYSVKRFIGREYDDAIEDVERVAYEVMSDPDDTGAIVLKCDQAEDGSFYPEEISAYVIAKLIYAAEEYKNTPVTKAVISVPAYFNDEQREATATAGRLAGLEAVRIMREPIAAALAYGLSAEEDQTVLVFDLGGGTYDVSLLEVGGGVIEVLSTGGDPHLGGDDWDAAITSWLISDHLKPAGVDCTNPGILSNLKAIAEAAKIKLSTDEKVVIRMPVGGGIEAVLTRQMFEGMTADLFRRARLPLDQACWQAGVDLGTAVREFDDAVKSVKKGGKGGSGNRAGAGAAADLAATGAPEIRPKRRMPVTEVLLVGGATRMPAVRRFVRNMTGIEPRDNAVDPDLAVALGAAVQAGIYEGQLSDLMVMDVWQASLMRAYAQQVAAEQEAAAAGEELAFRDSGNDGGSDGWDDEELGEVEEEEGGI